MEKNSKTIKAKYNKLPIQAKASFWFLVCMILQKGISVITTPIFTRILNTTEYGEFNLFTSWKGIITVFATMNLSYGVFAQGLVKFEDRRTEFVSAIEGLSTLIISVWFAVYILFCNRWNTLFSLNTYEMIAMFVTMWSTAVFDFWASEEKVNYRYRNLVKVALIVSVLKPVVGILVVTNTKNKVTARIVSLAIIDFIVFAPLFIKQIKKGKSLFSIKIWKYALMFNIPLIPHYLSQTVLNSADRIMIGKMIGPSEAGIYSLAYSLSMLVTLINKAVMQTMSPWMYQKMKERKIEDIKGIAYLALIAVAVLNLFLIALSPEIIRIFAPIEYFDARWIVPPVAMSVVFMFSYDLFAKFEFYYEKTIFIMIASISGAILNVILNYIFIGKYGYIAAGYTTMICYILYTIGHYLFMNKICKDRFNGAKPYDFKVLLLIYTVFMVAGFGIMITYNYIIIRYSIIAIFAIVTVIFRKNIVGFVKKMFSIRKSK